MDRKIVEVNFSGSALSESVRVIDPEATLKAWEKVRCWCDCDLEVNPANGYFGVRLREAIPRETIWEWKEVFFTFNEENGVYAFPETRRILTIEAAPAGLSLAPVTSKLGEARSGAVIYQINNVPDISIEGAIARLNRVALPFNKFQVDWRDCIEGANLVFQ